MAGRKIWAPDRRDMIWIGVPGTRCATDSRLRGGNPQAGREMKDIHPLVVLSPKVFNERTGIVIGLPMTTAAFNETNPFAVKFTGSNRKTSYILGHQPKSFDWRAREAKPHPWKQIPEDVFALVCETLNQIIAIGS
jgi:mRNA interferase MazF